MEDFVPYELAVKLKEKGFTCKYPFAMYDEVGIFYELYTSAGYTQYYDYRDFDEHNYIAPTISQVLKWLREEKKISIEVGIHCSLKWVCGVYEFSSDGIADFTQYNNNGIDDTVYILYDSYELAALAGIEYCLDNLI